ncbi:hypothetical protein [Mastigocoleus testarum]|nr:hypothetical protein [Mastigocoleus testarum]
MVQALSSGAMLPTGATQGAFASVSGQVICADTLNKPEYWRE